MSGTEEYSAELPGSDGEHELQECYGTSKRARAFYSRQMLNHLNEEMREFIRDFSDAEDPRAAALAWIDRRRSASSDVFADNILDVDPMEPIQLDGAVQPKIDQFIRSSE